MLTTLDAVLSAHRDDAAEYLEGALSLSNHLPMAVAALAEMGAAPERIAAFAATYRTRHGLAPAGPAERAARERWRDRLAHEHRDRVLAAELPRLAEGIGGGAFHPAIRAAYAFARGDDDELAAGLAYWEAATLPIPRLATVRTVSAPEALEVLRAAGLTSPSREDLIALRVAAVARSPRFAVVADLAPPASELPRLAVAAAAAFAARSDFTALHMMTATHAMRTFAERLDVDGAMPGFWRAYAAAAADAAAFPTLQRSELDALRAEAPASWEPLLVKAIVHDDDHVVKATYTAWREDQRLDEPVFRTAIARYQQRVMRTVPTARNGPSPR